MSKRILIAGASSGIGNEIFTRLASANELVTLSRSGVPGSDTDFKCDVLRDDLPPVDGALDGLVYCPGSITLKPFRGLKTQDFTNDFEINVLGAVRIIQAYLKNLQQAVLPSVLLFSTVAVSKGMPFHASIAASKGAVEALVRSLAAEFAPKIRFNAVAPSLTDTKLAVKLLRNDKQRDAAANRHPMKRIGSVEDIAAAADYLLSDNASWVTGQVFNIDGGLSALASNT